MFLKGLTDADITSVCECCQNYLNGAANRRGVSKMKKYKTTLRKLADTSLPLKTKRRIIEQKGGGFIGPLLGILAPLLGSLFSRK